MHLLFHRLQEVVESAKVRLENGVPRGSSSSSSSGPTAGPAGHPVPSYGGPTHLFPHSPQAAMSSAAAPGHPQQHAQQQQQQQHDGGRHEEHVVEVEKSNMVMLVSWKFRVMKRNGVGAARGSPCYVV
jgi:hypothetical protein